MYWVELPLILLLTVVIHYNSSSTHWLKLYPLIILIIAAMIFVLVFYFRVIELSYSDIRYIGRFTSRDSALITKGKTLVLRPEKHGKIRIFLRGVDEKSELTWSRESNDEPMEICMFRGKAWGGKRTLGRILDYFGADKAELDEILASDSYEKSYQTVTVTTALDEVERKEIRIRIDATV